MKITKEEILSRNEKIRDYLISNPTKLRADYTDTAKKFNVTAETVRHLARSLRSRWDLPDVKEKTAFVEVVEEFKITDQVLIRRENAEIKSLKKKLEQAVKDYETLSDAYDIALNLKSSPANDCLPVIPKNEKLKQEATAIIQISDGHFGKIVVPSTVNGLNEYNPEIAKRRMAVCAENTIKLIKKERQDIAIDNLVIILGGDFLENSQLHSHSEMITSMSPMEETLFARDILRNYIKSVLDSAKFKKVVVVCTRGNHSRITHKMNASVDYKMNYETILYNVLKEDFKSEKNVEWSIPDSEIAEVDVYGFTLRAIHGHQVKFQGGVGGLTIPLNKYIMRMDQISKASFNFVHHYHNLSYPTNNTTVNGSIVGYDPYALSIGCSYQPPMQSFQLLDANRGITIKAPIFCD